MVGISMPRNLSSEELEKLFPDLKVIRRIGSGSFKVVYEVRKGDQHYALKILTDDVDYNRLYRETDAMRVIDSPFVAKLHEFQVTRNADISIAYILEEFIDGHELKTFTDNGRIYSAVELMTFLDQMLQGLEACWSKRIVHRDIKPANIMIRRDGSPVIVDFGLSRHLDLSSLTSTDHSFMGTGPFAPPELLQYSKHDIDSKTDLYSLGITAYMMCTGQHPYTDGRKKYPTTMSEMRDVQAVPPHELNSQIPESISRFVMRLMNRNRVDRFKDAAQARLKLSQIKTE
jgi:eukaryotic-like serine/threonine-protein kinase